MKISKKEIRAMAILKSFIVIFVINMVVWCIIDSNYKIQNIVLYRAGLLIFDLAIYIIPYTIFTKSSKKQYIYEHLKSEMIEVIPINRKKHVSQATYYAVRKRCSKEISIFIKYAEEESKEEFEKIEKSKFFDDYVPFEKK